MEIHQRKLKELKPAEYNPRYIKDKDFNHLKESLKEFTAVEPAIVNRHKSRFDIIIGGHQRIKAANSLGWKFFPCVYVELPLEKEKELNIRLNKNTGDFDFDILANEFDMDNLLDWGFDKFDFGIDEDELNEAANSEDTHIKLTEKFVVPPFSILDARQGYWQERKGYWKNLIKDDGESRKNTLISDPTNLMREINSVSILDPVLAELAVKWFGLEKGKSFDCFAGDSVFGYVASYLGNNFTGIELRKEQVDLNNSRVKEYGLPANYICDDGRNVLNHIEANSQDLLFSCPPYFDLEIYSDLENDASNQKEYSDFIQILEDAFSGAIKCLKDNRFAFIVVGDIRDKKGFYRDFIESIKTIFHKYGMKTYNEMILIDQVGTLPQRVGLYMKNRKIGKCHQNILVFYKGDPKKIKEIFPEIEVNIESENLE